MDYEKKYNEALSKCKAYIDDTEKRWSEEFSRATEEVFKEIFPELRESEDERIRKELIYFLRSPFIKENLTDEKVAPWLEWLEKQEEQKPAEWSEVELEFRGEKVTVKRPFFRDDKGRGYSTTKQDEEVAWNALRAWCEKKGISIYDLYPKAEWSKEDADILNCCISSIEEAKENRYAYKETDGDTSYDHEIAWLKSLRPDTFQNGNSRWKPSEEQMDSLRDTIVQTKGYSYSMYLPELYEQLKKL